MASSLDILDNMLDDALEIQEILSESPKEFKDRLDYIQTVKHSTQRAMYYYVMKKLETLSEENNNIKTKINTLISILDNVSKTLNETSQISDEIVKVLNESRMSTLETLSHKTVMGDKELIGDNVTFPLEDPVVEVLKQQDFKKNPLGGNTRKSRKSKKRKTRKGGKSKK
jgi:hypothetical protein